MNQRLAPQNIQVENAIISTCLQHKAAFEIAVGVLKAEAFYNGPNKMIFQAMVRLHNEGTTIDPLTVELELKKTHESEKVGGLPDLLSRINQPPIINVTDYCEVIQDCYLKREIGKLCLTFYNYSFDDGSNPMDLMDKMMAQVSTLSNSSSIEDVDGMAENCKNFIIKLDERRHKDEKGITQGITSGYAEIDAKTFGWQPEDLITLAALSSMGKTALALNFARNAALDPHNPTPVAFFSREMSKAKLMDRLVSMESEILLSLIRGGSIDESQYQIIMTKGIKRLEKAPIYLIPAHGLTSLDVQRKGRQLVKKYGVGLIIDDYLQIAKPIDAKEQRERQLAQASATNKQTAQLLSIPFIQLSQVTKELEKKPLKGERREPVISDLRESSAIGNDSDMVGFIYRPEYFGDMVDENGQSTKGVTYLKWAKFRDGEKDIKIKLRSNLAIQKFYSIDEPDEQPFQTNGNWKKVNTEDQKFQLK